MRKVLFALLVIAIGLAFTQSASAVSGSDFNAGRIMDDGIFFNPSTIDQGTIQGFLNSKVPTCDTWGQQPYGGTTRAAYGTSAGYPPPYTCLKDFRQDTPNKVAETGLCNAYTGGNKSAAEIIYDVGNACGVSQKVILVLLQKEQSLITDDWPWSIQYRSATGYGCPDTAPCDTEYYGFFNQVYNAARQFKRYARDESLFRYRAYRDNYVQYNPDTSCGGSTIYLYNQTTAGLYNYTPYQPNVAALNNLYGNGDACSAYGNRNFWRMFNDWFGSTYRENSEITISTPIDVSNPNPQVGDIITISYTVQNKSSIPVDTGTLWICTFINNKGLGGGTNRKVLAPNETLTISMNYNVLETGVLIIKACGNTPNGPGWVADYPFTVNTIDREKAYTVIPNPVTITTPITLSSTSPKLGEPVTLSYTVQNKGSSSIDSGALWICMYVNGKGVGVGGNRKVLASNETLTISYSTVLNESGQLRIIACGNTPSGPGWVASYPTATQTTDRDKSYTVSASPLIINTEVTSSDSLPKVGETVTAFYTVQNLSNTNIDTGYLWVCVALGGRAFGGGAVRKVLAPNEMVAVSLPILLSSTGTLQVTACGNIPNGPDGWVYGYPAAANENHRTKQYNVASSPVLITTPVALSSSPAHVGQPTTISYTVQNKSSVSIDTGYLWVCIALNGSAFGGGSNRKVLLSNETFTISFTFTPSQTGTLEATPCGNTPNGPDGWVYGYPAAENNQTRTRSFTVSP